MGWVLWSRRRQISKAGKSCRAEQVFYMYEFPLKSRRQFPIGRNSFLSWKCKKRTPCLGVFNRVWACLDTVSYHPNTPIPPFSKKAGVGCVKFTHAPNALLVKRAQVQFTLDYLGLPMISRPKTRSQASAFCHKRQVATIRNHLQLSATICIYCGPNRRILVPLRTYLHPDAEVAGRCL
jgi:hypothetical protein